MNLVAFSLVILVEPVQALLHGLGARPDVQGVLGNLPRNALHVRRFPIKHIGVRAEEVNECANLFRIQASADPYHLPIDSRWVERDLLGPLDLLERARALLGIGLVLIELLVEQGQLQRGQHHGGMLDAFDVALVGPREGPVDGDDPTRASILSLR